MEILERKTSILNQLFTKYLSWTILTYQLYRQNHKSNIIDFTNPAASADYIMNTRMNKHEEHVVQLRGWRLDLSYDIVKLDREITPILNSKETAKYNKLTENIINRLKATGHRTKELTKNEWLNIPWLIGNSGPGFYLVWMKEQDNLFDWLKNQNPTYKEFLSEHLEDRVKILTQQLL